MDDITIARAVHVLTIIHWIGGLAFVTLVVLPLARTRVPPFDRFLLFENVEKKFSAQVRLSVPLAAISGFWMVERMDLWPRFADLHYWWLTARPRTDAEAAFRLIARLHYVLLALAAITAAGAVAGAHGLFF